VDIITRSSYIEISC